MLLLEWFRNLNFLFWILLFFVRGNIKNNGTTICTYILKNYIYDHYTGRIWCNMTSDNNQRQIPILMYSSSNAASYVIITSPTSTIVKTVVFTLVLFRRVIAIKNQNASEWSIIVNICFENKKYDICRFCVTDPKHTIVNRKMWGFSTNFRQI